MKNLGVFFLSMLVVLAILVNMGWIRDVGIFGIADDVYSRVTPVVDNVTNWVSNIFIFDDVDFDDNDSVYVIRVRFNASDGYIYYCDVLGKIPSLDDVDSLGNIEPFSNLGDWKICYTNFPRKLTLKISAGWVRIIDETLPFYNRIFWSKIGPVSTGKYVTKVMLYSEYVENYQGQTGSM